MVDFMSLLLLIVVYRRRPPPPERLAPLALEDPLALLARALAPLYPPELPNALEPPELRLPPTSRLPTRSLPPLPARLLWLDTPGLALRVPDRSAAAAREPPPADCVPTPAPPVPRLAPDWRLERESPRAVPPYRFAVALFAYGAPPRC